MIDAVSADQLGVLSSYSANPDFIMMSAPSTDD